METTDCSMLEILIECHEPVDLIDIRSKKQFSVMHIPRARSVPFSELAKPKHFLKWRRTSAPIYVVADDRVKTSLALGILRACGYQNATDWMAE